VPHEDAGKNRRHRGVHRRADSNAKSAFAVGNLMTRHIRENYRGRPQTTATATAGRSGILHRSYISEVHREGGTVNLDVGVLRSSPDASNALKYAAVHEYGGTITGRPWLTIPLKAALTARGVARGTARSFSNTFFDKSAAGNLILFQKRGHERVPLFVLKHRVKIKARPALQPAAEYGAPILEQRVADNVAKAVA
jgi:hypothetical protein